MSLRYRSSPENDGHELVCLVVCMQGLDPVAARQGNFPTMVAGGEMLLSG